MTHRLKLSTYYLSTAAYRVRIALKLKQIDHDLIPINLLAKEHLNDDFFAHNPDGLIPTLESGEQVLNQSMAILEYLEEIYPTPAILPDKPIDRAYVRGLAQTVVSDMHPLNNLRVYTFLMSDMGFDENDKMIWYFHWLEQGFKSLEARLANDSRTGLCCFGDTPSLADICLVPQVFNANRFEFDLSNYPNVQRINQHCLSLASFAEAQPMRQADAPQ